MATNPYASPVQSFMQGYNFVDQAAARREDRQWQREQRERQREQWSREDRQRELQTAVNNVEPHIRNERGEIDPDRLNQVLQERPGVRDSFLTMAQESTGRDDLEDVAFRRRRDTDYDDVRLRGKQVPMVRTRDGEGWQPLTDSDRDEDNVITVDDRNVPGIIAGAARQAEDPLYEELVTQRQEQARRDDLASFYEGYRQDTVEAPEQPERQGPQTVSEDVQQIGFMEEALGRQGAQTTPQPERETPEAQTIDNAALPNGETYEQQVRQAAQNPDVPAEDIVGTANTRQQRDIAQAALREAGRLTPGERQATPEQGQAAEQSATGSNNIEQIDQEIREASARVDELEQQISGQGGGVFEAASQFSISGERPNPEARGTQRDQMQSELEQARERLRSAQQQREALVASTPQSSPATDLRQMAGQDVSEGEQRRTSARPQAAQQPQAEAQEVSQQPASSGFAGPGTIAPSPQQQREANRVRARGRQIARQQQVASAANQQIEQFNGQIDRISNAVRNGVIDGSTANDLIEQIRNPETNNEVVEREDGSIVTVNKDTGGVVNTVASSGGEEGRPGMFTGEGAPDPGSRQEFSTANDVAASVAPDNEYGQSRIVTAMGQLRDQGVRMTPNQWQTVLSEGESSIGRDTGIFDFTGKSRDEITAEDTTKAVMGNMTGARSLSEFQETVENPVNEAAEAHNLPKTKTLANTSAVIGQLQRGQSGLPPEQARAVAKRAVQNPGVARRVINNDDVSAEEKAQFLLQRVQGSQ